MSDNGTGIVLRSYFALTRPLNSVIGGVSIFIGALLTGSLEPPLSLLLAVLSGMLITGGANAINDYYDIDIDRINRPARPIPSGGVSHRGARIFALTLYAAGIAMAIPISRLCVSIALFAVAGTFVYSARLKRMPLYGNLMVAFITALAFVYGGAAVGRLKESFFPAAFAFLYHLGREVIKDLEDSLGDRISGAETLPLRYGTRVALSVATVSFVLLIVLTFLPFIFSIYGLIYLIAVVLGVDLILVYSIFSAWSDTGHGNLTRLSKILKAGMLFGLFALYLGTL